jgi:hypothetical protein
MNKPASPLCLELIKYQKSHAEMMVTKYPGYVKLFEDNAETLFDSIHKLNFSEKNGWQQHQTVQGLFLVRVPRTLFSAFQQIMNGDYYESLATCRIAYESLLRILFIERYPADWSTTLLPEKGKRQFKASRFVVDDLKVAQEDRTYTFLSLPIHSHKQSVLSAIKKGTQGTGIVLDPGYEFSEREMSIAFNNLLAILYMASRIFTELFSKFLLTSESFYPTALESGIKTMPNRFSDYPAYIDSVLTEIRNSPQH